MASLTARIRTLPLSVITDSAAALTYFMVLSLLPGIALTIAAAALIAGDGTADSVLQIIDDLAPRSVTATFEEPVNSVAADSRLSGTVVLVSLGISLFTASRYVAAFGRAADRIQGRTTGRQPFWRSRPLAMLLVAAMVVLLPLTLLTLLVTGPIAVAVAQAIGVPDGGRQLFEILRWPLLGAVGVSMLTILYLSSEEMRQAGFRRVIPGALVAIACWLVASGVFSYFVANLTSFSLVYGSIAGFVVFLIWLYVSNIAVLTGMVANALRLGTIPAAETEQGPPE